MSRAPTTTETYLHGVRDIVVSRAIASGEITPDQGQRLHAAKLMYGVGDGSYRGITVFGSWANGNGDNRADIVEVAATGQESWIQLAGTVVHELAHVLAGLEAGHSVEWKDTARSLGFRIRPKAAGQVYHLSMLDPRIRLAAYRLAQSIADGRPEFQSLLTGFVAPRTPRPCSAGVGTRGGTSRGKGSGSRLRLWECACQPRPVKVRVASDHFQATCHVCQTAFTRKS